MSDRPRAPNERRDEERDDRVAVDPDAPPTAEELAAAELLRDGLEQGTIAPHDDLDLVAALRAAWAPEPLDMQVHATLLESVTGGGSSEGSAPSAEELHLAGTLRHALDAKGGDPGEVVTALRSAWNPAPIDEAEHRAIVRAALEKGAPAANVVALRPQQPARIFAVTTTTVLALAASVIVWMTTAAPPTEMPLARTRSTQPLFDEPFKEGETSARIDRIAGARASDYRDNRFAKWGVR
jgi:hypothetical protein